MQPGDNNAKGGVSHDSDHCWQEGSGKTKRIIDMTNEKAKTSQHDVVFIDDDNRYIFDIDHSVRFINASEYAILTPEMFLGFLCGMLSQNFDVGVIFIDAFKKLLKTDLNQADWFFKRLETLCQKHNVDFVLSVSEDPANLPEFMKGYLI